MGKSSSSIEDVVIVSNYAIKSIVFSFSKLGVERQVGHGVVGVSVEVSSNVDGSLVEALIVVICISLKLMSIDEVIDKSQKTFFSVVKAYSLWINVEREVIVPLDVHKVVVEVEYWEQ